MGSAVAASMLALYEALVAEESLAGVQKGFGPPDNAPEQESIFIMGISDATEEFAALGAGRVEETWSIDIRITVHDPTDNQVDGGQEVLLRGEAIREAIRSIVYADNQTLKGSVRIAQMGPRSYAWGAAVNSGRVYGVDCPIQCRARIT